MSACFTSNRLWSTRCFFKSRAILVALPFGMRVTVSMRLIRKRERT